MEKHIRVGRLYLTSNNMKTKIGQLKKALLIPLLACGLTTAPAKAQDFDTRYQALCVYAIVVDRDVQDWNDHCGGNKDSKTEDCIRNRAILLEQAKMFITLASGYKNDKSNCIEDLETRTVNHDIGICNWNINCLGRDKSNTPLDERCQDTSAALDNQLKDLLNDLKNCMQQKDL